MQKCKAFGSLDKDFEIQPKKALLRVKDVKKTPPKNMKNGDLRAQRLQ